MTFSGGREIDWATAEMRDGALSVGVAGPRPKGWVRQFESVLRLLARDGGRWGDITVGKKRIKVSDVREGSEEALYELLESALLQVNSDLLQGNEGDSAASERIRGPSEESPQMQADSRMTDTFRGFARHGVNGARGDIAPGR